MARHKEHFEHGTVSRYRQGNCDGNGNRCDACKRAMSDSKKGQRAGMPSGTVTSIEGRRRTNHVPSQSNSRPSPSNPEPVMGAVERSIHEHYDKFRDEHGPRIELLLSGARIMDNPDNKGIWPTTMRQMEMIIDKITAKKKTKSGGRLATVSAMAGRRPTGSG